MENGENNNLVPSTEVPTVPVVEQTTQPVVNTPVQSEPQVIVQATNSEQPKQKKKIDKNLIVRLVAVLVVVLAVAAYFIFFFEWKPKEDPSDPKSVAYTYINSIIEKDFSRSFKYAYLPNNSFVDGDDYFTFISNNKKYNNISDKKIDSVNKIDKSQTNAEYEVILNDNTNYNLKLNMDSSGNWFVVVDNLFIEDWKIEVPGGSKLYIDDTLVDNNLAKKSDNHDIYTIPAIAPSKKEFKIVTSFDEYKTSFDVAGSNSGDKIIPELNKEDEINSSLEYIKDTWNSLYKDYLSNTPKTDVLKDYFDSSFKEEDMDKYYTKSFDSLTRKGNKNSVYTNIELSDIKINENKKSYIEGNNVIKIEFGYRVDFLVDYVYSGSTDSKEYMTRYSSIELIKDNNKYKIHKITDEKLLNYLKYIDKEFK